MEVYGGEVNRLIEELGRLPGIGSKTAQRLAFHIISMPEERALALSDAIVNAKKNIKYCSCCYTITDREVCPICSSPNRNHKVIMVVALGIGPADIRISELMRRLQNEDVDELIIATGSGPEGEATAMYISKLVKPAGIKVSRIASGVPVGGDLECIDEVTLLRALEGRVYL